MQRTAIVTGAGRGLGRAMALGLARADIRVVATVARERREIQAVAAEASEGAIFPMVADVTREADAQRVVDAALGQFGALDILVNNAGRGMRYVSESFMTDATRFWEVEPDTWRMVIDTNVNGQLAGAGRCDGDGHAAGLLPSGSEGEAARSHDHGSAAALARIEGRRPCLGVSGHRQSVGCRQSARGNGERWLG